MANLKLSTWAMGVNPSPTLAVDSKAKALAAAGEDICGFGTGEPNFDTPQFIKEACMQALQEGKTKYSPVPGLPPLRAALAEKYAQENGIVFEAGTPKAENIVVSPGGKYSCMLAMQAVCSPGEGVLIPAPYWVSYPEMAKLTGAVPITVETSAQTDFKLTVADLEAAAASAKTAGTPLRMLVLNSPSNPTGAVYSKNELEPIVNWCIENRLYILSDEIYEYLLYEGAQHYSPAAFSPQAAEHVITVSGFSKTFAMTGWRIGTLLASAPIAKACATIQSQTSSNTNTFAQYGALAAVTNKAAAQEAIAEELVMFNRRRTLFYEGLQSLPGITCVRPLGAFYIFADVSGTGLSADEFCLRLLEEEKVAAVPGTGFGAPNHVRFSYAVTREVIGKGLDRMEQFLARLKG